MSQDAPNAEIDQAVARYVQQLTHADSRPLALTDRTLHDLASSARSCLYQGTRLVAIGRYDEAIQQLKQAAYLMPDDLFTHVVLSDAYMKRYQRSYKRRDRLEANRIATICQTLDPAHGHAYAVFQGIDAIHRERTALWRARITLASVLLGLFLAVSVIF